MKRTVLLTSIYNNASSVTPLTLNLVRTAPIYRTALASGQLYLQAIGGQGPYTYSATGLPAGLSLNTATGVVTGTPTTLGHNVITATVTDSATNTFTTTFSIDVLSRLVNSGGAPRDIENGFPVSFQYAVTGATGSLTWSTTLGPLPNGLSLSPGGLLSGTPSETPNTTIPFTVAVTDSGTGESISIQASVYVWPALSSGGATPSYQAIVGVPLPIPYIGMAGGKPPYSYAFDTVSSPTTNSVSVVSGLGISAEIAAISPLNSGTFICKLSDGTNSVSGRVSFGVSPPTAVWGWSDATIVGNPALIPVGTLVEQILPPGLTLNFDSNSLIATAIAEQQFPSTLINCFTITDALGYSASMLGFSLSATLSLPSADTGNVLARGTDGKLFVPAVAGPQGPMGATGSQGPQGAAGPQGLQGLQGVQGAVGPQGAVGAQGAVGSQGSTGPQGAIGVQGSTGSQGAAGTNGTNGAQGSQGPQGTQGVAGTNGTNGAQGPQGNQGVAGSQGPQGTTGSQGVAGPQGTAGTNGTNGAQGPQGATGTGTQGPQGPQGSSGAASGAFIKRTLLTASSGTFTTQATTSTIKIRGIGGGGGSGATNYTGGPGGSAVGLGGGGGGSIADRVIAVSPSTGYSYVCGSAGVGGAVGNNAGTAGGNSTFTVGATTITAKGGSGGLALSGIGPASAVQSMDGANGGAAAVNDDFGATGDNGGTGFGIKTTDSTPATLQLAVGGTGGASIWGVRAPQATAAAGNQYGGGGGGVKSTSTANVAGKNGCAGCWIVEEYS